MKSGAGGDWERIDEQFDASIVKQGDLSCVSAVGEMLLKYRNIAISQKEIRDKIGSPATLINLAKFLNSVDSSEDGQMWQGIFLEQHYLDFVLGQSNFGVVLQEPFFLAHAVYVDGVTKDRLIKIKDPFDQTSYKMTREEFLKHWSGGVIFRWTNLS
jgi:filamentous hemagglutinin